MTTRKGPVMIAISDPATRETVSLCIVYPHGLVDDDSRNQMIAELGKAATQIATIFGDSAFVAPKIRI